MLIDLPRLTAGLVIDAIGDDPQVEVIVTEGDGCDLLRVATDTAADVLVTTLDDEPHLGELLDRCPHIKTLAVAEHGVRTILLELRPQRTELGDLAHKTLHAALQAARAPRPVWMA